MLNTLFSSKILSTGATLQLGPIRLHVENWEYCALKSSAWCQKFGVPCRFFSACKWGLGLFLSRLRAVSLFSWSVEQNARDTQMTTRGTEGARRERHVTLVSRVFAAQRPHARALPLLNLRKKSGCSQCSGLHVCFHSSTSILAEKLHQTTIKKQKSSKKSNFF